MPTIERMGLEVPEYTSAAAKKLKHLLDSGYEVAGLVLVGIDYDRDGKEIVEHIGCTHDGMVFNWEDDGKPEQAQPVAWCPDVCPITGLPFFMWIEHHKTGRMVPTYGGPYDSYTIPVREKDGSYCRERYDHDNGWWVTDEVDDVGIQIVSDQAHVSDEAPPPRQPLLASDIVTMYDENPRSDSEMIAFARAIEAAHGITKENT